jgi:acyl carrier protein phosphodiesterase
MMHYMIVQNWLESYQTLSGIEKIMIQMDYRTQNQSKMRFGINHLKKDYVIYEQEFFEFFELIQNHIHHFKSHLA